MLTYSQRRSMARHGQANIDREQAAWKAEESAKAETANRARIEANKAARQAEQSRVKYTREDLAGAVIIRTASGWRKVAKVNAKTVSVETGYSWTDRVAFDKITDYRKAGA